MDDFKLPPALEELLRKQWFEMRQNNIPTINPHGGFGFSGTKDVQQWDSPSVYRPRQRWMHPPSGSVGPDQQMYYLPTFQYQYQNPKVRI